MSARSALRNVLTGRFIAGYSLEEQSLRVGMLGGLVKAKLVGLLRN